jgi:hypothetical protein
MVAPPLGLFRFDDQRNSHEFTQCGGNRFSPGRFVASAPELKSSSTRLFVAAFIADWEENCRDDGELNHLGGRANVCFAVQAADTAATLGHFPMTENQEAFLEYLRPALARQRVRGQ